MLDIKIIREQPELVRAAIKAKRGDNVLDEVTELDSTRRAMIARVDILKNKRNTVSDEIARLKRNKENADDVIAEMKVVSDEITNLDVELRSIEEKLSALLDTIPNIPHESVPHGESAEKNIEVRRWAPAGKNKPFEKIEGLDHLQVAEKYSLFDFARGAKITGAGFPIYTGRGAALERAFINFMIAEHTRSHGYTEILPPFFVNEASLRGTGNLPKFRDQLYYMNEDDLFAIPTAEVPVTNIFRDEVLKAEDLPIKYCAFSACFRREAGSYGKDTRGFLRVHEFNKVELVKFSLPEHSYEEHEKLTTDAERMLELLEIPYRRLLLCDGDTSFASAKTYDLEVWAPIEGKWLEASSCSNFEAFQARRANIRFKRDPKAKPEFLHTLNGSGLATSRLMVAFLENHQQPDGTIKIPEVLHPFLTFTTIS
ncbi:MAG TPA: serine--tRNA ligase [Candidatus Kapabacteria bacterium]|nr:serine--tRNA ligase [Candidatus Kapabacteria bacterium]